MDYIEHHGVRGQKWGIRRSPEELGHAPKRKEKLSKKQPERKQKRFRLSPKFKATMKVAAPLAAAVLVNVGSHVIAGGHSAILSAVTYEVGESAVERFFDYYEALRNK